MGRMTQEQAVKAVIEAIRNEGSHPQYHREVMARHRREWPTLWKALDALVKADAAG